MSIVNVAEKIDQSKFTRFHSMVIFLSRFLVFFDGIELGLLGTIAKPLIKKWSLDPIQFGAISSYAAVGMILGGLVCGPLGDKFGRIKLILIKHILLQLLYLNGRLFSWFVRLRHLPIFGWHWYWGHCSNHSRASHRLFT